MSRINGLGDQYVALSRSSYSELGSSGRLFMVSNGAAGIAPGTALGTTPPIALHNPTGSSVLLTVLAARVGYISGTLGSGTVGYGANAQPAAPTGGVSLTAQNARIGSPIVAVGKAYAGATLASSPTLLAAAFQLGLLGSLASDLLDGAMAIQPGYALSLTGIATAGLSPLVIYSLMWEETPLSA